MPAEIVPGVLHITAATGGGADRYIRDLAAASTSRPHYVLHVGADVDVLENVGARRFAPLRAIGSGESDAAALTRWARSSGIGIAHLHGVDARCRTRLAALQSAAPMPYLVTLHDLQFVNPRAFDAAGMPEPDPDWILAIEPMLERAATVIVPSAFILDIALACAPRICATAIAPGLASATSPPIPATPTTFAAQAPSHIVAVVGAVGPHKGSGVLDALAHALTGSDVGIVVIGYTDTRLERGWVVPGSLYVHGAYADGALAGWLAAYRVETVLFPNRLPESFSYTLSEVWSAGLPVIVPDQGALGERVARDGGGWLLPPGFEADDAAALLVWLASPEGAADHDRVKSRISPSDALRLPTLEAMSREIDALYARFAPSLSETPDPGAARDALTPLLAANLDGFEFRKELINLTSELDQTTSRLAEAMQWNEKLERDGTAWAAKLEADIAELKREIERLGAENRVLTEQKTAFDLLPEMVRKYLLRRAVRARR
jgi:glycosyltransferase involved in cell wall biosynthesis